MPENELRETPRYTIRAQMEKDTPREVLQPYLARAISQMIDASIVAGIDFIRTSAPRAEWKDVDWASLHREGKTEEKVDSLLDGLTDDELGKTFDFALTIAANGVVGINEMDFYLAMANAAVSMLSRDKDAAKAKARAASGDGAGDGEEPKQRKSAQEALMEKKAKRGKATKKGRGATRLTVPNKKSK